MHGEKNAKRNGGQRTLGYFRALAKKRPGTNPSRWAYDVCKASRLLHLRLYSGECSPDEARRACKLLVEQHAKLCTMQGCEAIAAKVETRIQGIESCLSGGPPPRPALRSSEQTDEIREAVEEMRQLAERTVSRCSQLIERLSR